jgi:hypothetical protein
LFAAALIGLAACGNGTLGTPTPTQGSGSGPTGTGGSGATTSAGGPTSSGGGALASLQPCQMLNASFVSQLQLQPQGPDSSSSAPNCDWQRPVDSNGNNGYSVGLTLRTTQGLNDVDASGYTVTTNTVGGHPAKQLQSTVPGNCLVAIGVGSAQRVDVTVNAGTDTNQACQVAGQVAQQVAPELPSS